MRTVSRIVCVMLLLTIGVATAGAYSTDTTPPVTVPSPWMGTYREAQNVTLTCSDESGSGCGVTYFCGKTECKPTTEYKGPITISNSTTLLFYSSDNIGNKEAVRTYEYNIDPTLAYRFERNLPQPAQPWHFSSPSGLTMDIGGNVYVADTDNDRVEKFDSNGNYLTTLGTHGSGPGQFSRPTGIAIDPLGSIYVVDSGNNRVQKFDSSGMFLIQWGSFGSGTGQFNNPNGVAVDAGGNVYVVDSGNNRIQMFDSNGRYLIQWGSVGSGSGQFFYPYGVALDALGNVYISDASNNRIQKFDREGSFLNQWGTYGNGAGQFSGPQGMAVDPFGNVYVSDSGNSRIQKFDRKGTYLDQWGSQGLGAGQFYYPFGVALDVLGNIYVVEYGNSRIQKFDSSGTYLSRWGTVGYGNGEFNRPSKVAVDAGGNVYVADTRNDRIQKFNSSGTYVSQWGTAGYGSGQFFSPTDVAVDAVGNIYVSDIYNYFTYKIQKFDSNGVLLSLWYSPWGGNGQYSYPSGIVVDAGGNVYAADDIIHRIQKFDSTGTYLNQWGTLGSGNGQFMTPAGLAVDAGGNLYVADRDNHRIQRFDSSGAYLSQWGFQGSGAGQFKHPSDVAVDADGNIYVADSDNNRIQKFDSNGIFLTQWGTFGSGSGQFSNPSGVTVDTAGNVFVADTNNNRIQKFSLAVGKPGAPAGVSAVAGDGEASVSFTSPATDGGSPVLFYTVRATPGNSTATGNGTSLIVSGLTNGTPYTFTVTATNAAGASLASSASDSVIPMARINALCGNDNGKTLTTTPTNLCNPGTPANLAGTGPWTWTCLGSYGGSNSGCSAQVQMYTLSTTITGNGSVNNGDGIACTGSPQTGTCSKSYPYGAGVTLLATVSDSLFCSWGGACSTCGSIPSCFITIDSTKICSAVFADPLLIAVSGTNQTFTLLQPAYAAAADGAIIKAQAVTFIENLLLDTDGRTVTIKGGYEPTFTTQTGVTIIKGTLTIGQGGLVVDRVQIN